MNRDRDYCCPTEDRATGSGSNAWNRVETTLYNGKVDSGVHSDTLSNQDEEPDYLQNLGFIDNKVGLLFCFVFFYLILFLNSE